MKETLKRIQKNSHLPMFILSGFGLLWAMGTPATVGGWLLNQAVLWSYLIGGIWLFTHRRNAWKRKYQHLKAKGGIGQMVIARVKQERVKEV